MKAHMKAGSAGGHEGGNRKAIKERTRLRGIAGGAPWERVRSRKFEPNGIVRKSRYSRRRQDEKAQGSQKELERKRGRSRKESEGRRKENEDVRALFVFLLRFGFPWLAAFGCDREARLALASPLKRNTTEAGGNFKILVDDKPQP